MKSARIAILIFTIGLIALASGCGKKGVEYTGCIYPNLQIPFLKDGNQWVYSATLYGNIPDTVTRKVTVLPNGRYYVSTVGAHYASYQVWYFDCQYLTCYDTIVTHPGPSVLYKYNMAAGDTINSKNTDNSGGYIYSLVVSLDVLDTVKYYSSFYRNDTLIHYTTDSIYHAVQIRTEVPPLDVQNSFWTYNYGMLKQEGRDTFKLISKNF